MSLRVRRLLATDEPQWRNLFAAYIEFYQASVSSEVVDETWRRLLSEDAQFHVGLAAVDAADHMIGLAHVLFHRSTWSNTWYCYLEDLFVAPAARGAGTGKALIEAVYAEADKRQCTRTYWTTQEFNYRARGLYDQLASKSPFIQYRR